MRSYSPPKDFRPDSTKARKVRPGLDLPCEFLDEIKSIDENLFLVWHPFKVMWESGAMNQYTGLQDDERFAIHEEYGEEVWGFVLKQPKSDAPQMECKWHLWCLCPHGYYHVSPLESTEPEYLKLLARRLYLQSIISDARGQKEWSKMSREQQAEFERKRQAAADDLFQQVQEENAWLVAKAMSNFASGQVAPTNPTKDVITSYPGQKNKSRIVRPIHDTEGGLVLPDFNG